MKIEGRKIIGPNRGIIAIPRGDGPDIIFIAEAVLDHKPFDKLCPPPKPVIKKIGGEDIPDIKDKNYQRQIQQYSERKTAWLVLTALQATKGLEWETVDLTNPSTWLLFRKNISFRGGQQLMHLNHPKGYREQKELWLQLCSTGNRVEQMSALIQWLLVEILSEIFH